MQDGLALSWLTPIVFKYYDYYFCLCAFVRMIVVVSGWMLPPLCCCGELCVFSILCYVCFFFNSSFVYVYRLEASGVIGKYHHPTRTVSHGAETPGCEC